jgi:hypothetical protein
MVFRRCLICPRGSGRRLCVPRIGPSLPIRLPQVPDIPADPTWGYPIPHEPDIVVHTGRKRALQGTRVLRPVVSSSRLHLALSDPFLPRRRAFGALASVQARQGHRVPGEEPATGLHPAQALYAQAVQSLKSSCTTGFKILGMVGNIPRMRQFHVWPSYSGLLSGFAQQLFRDATKSMCH